MTYYHTTTREAWEKIKVEGLRGMMFGYIYFTDDIEFASRFNRGVILQVDSTKLDEACIGRYREGMCDMFNTTDFINYSKDVPPELISVFSE